MSTYIYCYDVVICITNDKDELSMLNKKTPVFRVCATNNLKDPNDETNTISGVLIAEEDWNLLSDETRQFLILHEIGHIKNGSSGPRSTQQECDCDAYALKELTREEISIQLKELRKVARFSWRNAGFWECIHREYMILEKRVPLYVQCMMLWTAVFNLKDFMKTIRDEIKRRDERRALEKATNKMVSSLMTQLPF
jgi:hypothetical protein